MTEDRALDLVCRHIDGLLEDEGREELERLLAVDPGARRVYVRELRLHASLQVCLRGVGREKAFSDDAAQMRATREPIEEPTEEPAEEPAAPAAAEPARAPSSRTAASRRRRAARRRATGGRPLRIRYLLPLSAAAGILVAFLLSGRRPGEGLVIARVTAVGGEAWLVRPDARGPLRRDSALRRGDGIETAAEAAVSVGYRDGATLELSGGSFLSFTGTRDGDAAPKTLALERGELGADVSGGGARADMTVRTPHAEAVVLGTRFRVLAMSEKTRLEVTDGHVRLERLADGASVEVAAGEYAEAGEGIALLARPLAEPDAGPPAVVAREPLPEAPVSFEPVVFEPVAFEIEDFGSARNAARTDGLRGRPFLEELPGAQGGDALAVPGPGTAVTGEIDLAEGAWYLWVRWRDDSDPEHVAFQVLVDGKAAGRVRGRGDGMIWKWSRFAFTNAKDGRVRVTLRSLFRGYTIGDPLSNPEHPYRVVNRWDRLLVTGDPEYEPDRRSD